jgi:hypothetical protein
MRLFVTIRRSLRRSPVALLALAVGTGFVYGAPSFDGGTSVAFNAEDNATSAYTVNPAKLAYFTTSTIIFDVGGDWSLGTVKYTENGGSVEPGSPAEPGESAAELTINTAVGGTGFAAFRSGTTVFGFGAGLDWDKVSLGLSGTSVPELGYFPEGEVFSFSIPEKYVCGAVAFDMNPWAVGFSGKYTTVSHKAEDEADYSYSAELGLTDAEILGGVFYRSGGTHFDAGGGVQILKNRLELTEPFSPVAGGEATGMRFGGRVGYRNLLWSKCAFGVNCDVRLTPGITITDDDVDYDIAEGSELDLGIMPGFALYPDDRTTLAFDYNVGLRKVDLDTLSSRGRITGEYRFSETWTYSQVGLERWLTEDVSAKAGWRQNILAYPRNTMFAGACYRPNDRWSFNYDYVEGTISIDKISTFMTLSDVVDVGGHRITLAYSF